MVVAVVARHDPHWYANFDLALTELRVRDVTSRHPPTVGLSGRIDAFGVPGSHPGPMSFWLLAPVYRLLGASSWALVASTAALNLAAAAVAVWLGRRRAGLAGAVTATAAVAVLLHAIGPDRWLQPWNPYLPLLWWPVVLLAVWSVLDGDTAMIVVLAVAGSFCAQTHVSYVGLVACTGAVAAGALAVPALRHRDDGDRRRATLRWAALATLVVAVLWAPPLIEQVRNDPGNLTILREQFSDPAGPTVGLGRGVGVFLRGLDPWGLLAGRIDLDGPVWRGAALVVAWGAGALASWRRGATSLRRLHVVVGVALVAGLVSVSRIEGRVFDYLIFWLWPTAVLAAGSIVGSLVVLWPASDGERGRIAGRRVPCAATAAGAVLALALGSTLWQAGRAEPPQPGQARINERLIPPAVDALRSGEAPGSGPRGRYLVRSDDALSGGLNTYTLLLELERQGFEAGVDQVFAVSARPFRVLPPDDATAVVTYVTGAAIDDWRRRPDVVELAHAEPSAADATRYAQVRARVVADLRASGLDDEARVIDANLLALAADERVPHATLGRMREMIELGTPTSVFVSPVAP